MARTLFMTRQNHFNVLLLMESIENLQDDSPRKCEDGLHAFPLQTFDEDFSTGEFHDNPPNRMIRSAPIVRYSKDTPGEGRIIMQKCL
jgi:hypothetical protein